MNERDAPASPRRLVLAQRGPLILALCLAAGLAAFCWVPSVSSGASLLHFDAKAHLLVSRRVVDSLTPGWRQLGAVWLPLPHILNALPAQSDYLYRTGFFASGLSFVAFIGGLAGLGHAASRATRDSWAGAVAVAVPALNPGWLYLQTTPLTEPLFLGLVGGLAYFLVRWLEERRMRDLVVASLFSGLGCLVRYEAWPLAFLAMTSAVWSRRQTRGALAVSYGLGLVGPVVFFGIHSWVSTGMPFYVIGSENLTETKGHVFGSLSLLLGGAARAFGTPLTAAAGAALLLLALRPSTRSSPLLVTSVVALAPLGVTFTAYLAGHPEKARYTLLLGPALALLLAGATSQRRWLQGLALALAALQAPVVPGPLPVLKEATRDRRDVAARRPVVEALRREYQGGRILASMGSLAPVLFELQLPLREVVHEGNGNWWTYAVVDPWREVSWIVIVKGDVLDQVRSYRPGFPVGFVPVMEFPRVVVYRRADQVSPRAEVTGLTAGAGRIDIY